MMRRNANTIPIADWPTDIHAMWAWFTACARYTAITPSPLPQPVRALWPDVRSEYGVRAEDDPIDLTIRLTPLDIAKAELVLDWLCQLQARARSPLPGQKAWALRPQVVRCLTHFAIGFSAEQAAKAAGYSRPCRQTVYRQRDGAMQRIIDFRKKMH